MEQEESNKSNKSNENNGSDGSNESIEKEFNLKAKICITIHKYWWFLFVFATYVLFFLHAGFLLNQLFQYRIGYENKPEAFAQQDIVLCPCPFYAIEHLSKTTKNNSHLEKLFKEFKRIEKMTSLYHHKQASDLAVWDSMSISLVKELLFHRNDEFFLSLMCENRPVRYKLELNPTHFLCFRFSKSSCKLSQRQFLESRIYMHTYQGKQGGNDTIVRQLKVHNFGLEELFTASDLDHEIEGLLYIYFVDKQHLVSGSETHLTIGGETQADIILNIRKFSNTHRDDYPCLDTKYRLFYNLLSPNLSKRMLNLTESSSCVWYEIQTYLYRKYNCTILKYPIPYPEVPLPLNGCFNISRLSQDSITMSLIFNNWGNIHKKAELRCRNIRLCNEYRYDVSVDKLKWPKLKVLWKMISNYHNHDEYPGISHAFDSLLKDKSDLSRWRQNFLKFKIKAGEKKSNVMSEYFSYTSLNFFSDVGGILGFYLGACILSIKEFASYWFEYIMDKFFRKKEDDEEEKERDSNNENDENNKDEIETIADSKNLETEKV